MANEAPPPTPKDVPVRKLTNLECDFFWVWGYGFIRKKKQVNMEEKEEDPVKYWENRFETLAQHRKKCSYVDMLSDQWAEKAERYREMEMEYMEEDLSQFGLSDDNKEQTIVTDEGIEKRMRRREEKKEQRAAAAAAARGAAAAAAKEEEEGADIKKELMTVICSEAFLS